MSIRSCSWTSVSAIRTSFKLKLGSSTRNESVFASSLALTMSISFTDPFSRARAQARRYGHGVEDEIRVLMLHGVLHLVGMDHEADGGRMLRAEKRWRKRLGLPDGLIERVAP